MQFDGVENRLVNQALSISRPFWTTRHSARVNYARQKLDQGGRRVCSGLVPVPHLPPCEGHLLGDESDSAVPAVDPTSSIDSIAFTDRGVNLPDDPEDDQDVAA